MTASVSHRISGGGVTTPQGFKAAGTVAGFKPSGKADLAVLLSDGQAAVGAGVFTQNCVRAAPVDIAEEALQAGGGRIAAVVINSGQANASTGAGGADDARATVRVAAAEVGCEESNVLIASTGVIGRRFDVEVMTSALPGLISAASSQGGSDAAEAIMTTDLRKKEIGLEGVVGGVTVRVGGMAKGSGMIHPNMATMLGFITCDAAVSRPLWQDMVSRAADASFNAITVDGDTSTNDVLFAMANGGAGGEEVSDAASPEARALEAMVTEACMGLAKMIARDGEGATVLVEVKVSGASSDAAARQIARTVAGSSLTKAAVYGRDPNWGRIAGAAGRAGVPLDASMMSVGIGPYQLMRNGEPVEFDEQAASGYMKEKAEAGEDGYCSDADTVVIAVDLGDGDGSGFAWGCDLSYDYVKINAEYTT